MIACLAALTMTSCEDITDGEDKGETPAGLILAKGEIHLQMTVTETNESWKESSTSIVTVSVPVNFKMNIEHYYSTKDPEMIQLWKTIAGGKETPMLVGDGGAYEMTKEGHHDYDKPPLTADWKHTYYAYTECTSTHVSTVRTSAEELGNIVSIVYNFWENKYVVNAGGISDVKITWDGTTINHCNNTTKDVPVIAMVALVFNASVSGEELERFVKDPENYTLTIPLTTYQREVEDYGTVRTTSTTGRFVLNGKLIEPDVACCIEPVDESAYQDWIPQGGVDENEVGNSLTFRAFLHKKGEPGTLSDKKCKFMISLAGTSMEKGLCNNYPLNGKMDFDLKIAEDSKLTTHSFTHGQYAETRSSDNEIIITVNSHDFGAFGGLRVTAEFDDGTPSVEAYVKGDKNANTLRIPFDENKNHIADAWEKKIPGIGADKGSMWDEDTIHGQRYKGDGYTFYEEYRGFVTLDAWHIRTNPTKKDLFFYDRDGLVDTYYEKAGNPGGMTNHFINPSLMKWKGESPDFDNRVVNFNSKVYKYADQYAMYVIDAPAVDPDDPNDDGLSAGITVFSPGQDNQAMKRAYVVKINPKRIEAVFAKVSEPTKSAWIKKEMVSTVCHEIGHAIGVEHHHGGGPVPDNKDFEKDETIIAEGVLDCVMRYHHFSEVRPNVREGVSVFFGTRFCTGSDKAYKFFINSPDSSQVSIIWQDTYRSDDCMSQINVKSDP